MLHSCRSFSAAPAFAQSTAANGSIEGTVIDASGGVLPGVTVTITNTRTGAERIVVTNDKGLYRAPLLPLGTYRVVAELQGFKKFEQTGITLSVGQAAVINVTLASARSTRRSRSTPTSPPLDSARIDIGHTMSDQEVHNLPLVARNPYNFALVQPGVTGYRERRVRRAAPRRQRRGDAHQLSDRRQHQHRERSRRPAAAADVGSDDSGSQGRHHRLRAGVRPDDGHGLQRGDAVGHQHVPRRRQLSVPPQAVQRVPVLLRLRQHDDRCELPGGRRPTPRSRTRRPTPARRRSAGRSSRTSCSSTPAGSRRAAICRRAA